ncbi:MULTISPECIES: WhiB family transcriptional regulator [Amycolatopsis]|uniref:WhiB family transcriptional regulator, redox-sensing transcriptional regulator n=2 Tax=Amycolatopsis TaxID=1813 RepID=A0A1I3KS61_9PSEU|nr:WhiB family transcriptional regulator [Amycolatopsis sacchari]SFI75349.1 WhiB family transcriptional regulator, redox-sensing transcriptional regulator [Amycolatopsis sacchari]
MTNDLRLIGLAWDLDRLRWVPTDVLDDVVRRDGLCFWAWSDEPPEARNDRELAARLCAGCPVLDECLELELRTAGEETVGVWGAMCEQDRRALYPHWLRRGERAGRRGQ